MKKILLLIILIISVFFCPNVYAKQQLSSSFLKNDVTAKSIVNGCRFSMENVLDKNSGYLSINSFAMKFMNGMRQVGYTGNSSSFSAIESEPLLWLHKFQKINNLPKNNYISLSEIVKLDKMLLSRESIDNKLSAGLPLNKIASGSSNEPSSKHVAALFVLALQSLPTSIVKWNSTNLIDYLNIQGVGGDGGGVGYVNNSVCFFNYFPSLNNQCKSINKTMTPGLLKDDPSLVYAILHEYAHYIDGKLYSPNKKTSLGAVNTEGFNSISYDISTNCYPSSPWRFFKLKNPDNSKKEFVTTYAIGAETNTNEKGCRSSGEDFAESFAMYVMQGSTFRNLAKANPIVAQKYNWLKKNVFSGREYTTGVATNILAANKALETPYAQVLPSFMDYFTINNSFVWDYKIK